MLLTYESILEACIDAFFWFLKINFGMPGLHDVVFMHFLDILVNVTSQYMDFRAWNV